MTGQSNEAKSQESPKAAAAFYQYCLMGRNRSLAKLAQELGKTSAYTRCLEAWSSRHNWQERARLYDTKKSEEQEKIIAEEKEKVLRSGFALMHKRVEELDRLSRKLIEMTDHEQKIWIPETRTITTGEDSMQVVEKVVFNAPLFLVIEKYFAGIAAELGERVKKKEIAVTDLPPNVYIGFDPDKDGSET